MNYRVGQWSLTIIIILSALTLKAQDGPFEKIYFTPSISLGYTIGASFNVGVELDITTSTTTRSDRFKRAGISTSHYWVMGKRLNPHRITSINVMFENEFMDIKSGYGLLNYKWGYSNVNNWGLSAYAFDISFTNRDTMALWAGAKTLIYNRNDWNWFDYPYVSLYAKHKIAINE